MRNIIEQTLKWNCPLYINFIDFKKAFDSIHHDTLWKILRSYGVPLKIVSLIETFYNHFECSVILNNTSSEWFTVKSGVRQGCILSPILFLVVIDWVMRKTTSDKPRGIQWTLFSQLEDLDFADDLAFLSVKLDHLQEKNWSIREICKANWAYHQYIQDTSDEHQHHTNRTCYRKWWTTWVCTGLYLPG